MKKSFSFTAKLWVYKGYAAWHFVTVPKKESAAIKEQTKGVRRGWGSVPVKITIGKTTWDTSIFPEKTSGCFFLPIKVAVRKTEGVEKDDEVRVKLLVR